MKKVVTTGIIGVISLGLVGCDGYDTGEYVQNGSFKVVGEVGYYDLMRDVDTGCLYLEANDQHSLTPYFNEEGEIQGCGEDE